MDLMSYKIYVCIIHLLKWSEKKFTMMTSNSDFSQINKKCYKRNSRKFHKLRNISIAWKILYHYDLKCIEGIIWSVTTDKAMLL